MTERELIAWIQQRAPRFGQRVRLGIGDDCAIYRPQPGYDLLFTTDFTLEDRHFTWRDYKPHEAGWKAMARALSDLAAMGATPEFALVSLAASTECNLKGFFTGLIRCAKHYRVTIAGGDLTESPRLICDVSLAGRVPTGKAILRSGARPGDRLYVTGPMGTWKKNPVPRFDLRSTMLRHASAAIDVTDGLAMDLSRLLTASGCAAEIVNDPPLDPGATAAMGWHEGESYELLLASPKRLRLPYLGQVVAGITGQIRRLDSLGQSTLISASGWDPFPPEPHCLPSPDAPLASRPRNPLSRGK
ncbi:MAG: thiamine-phosphate kinase [Bryobacter sp.]|nr:thiamine-phosphate kinase [Bryobacter sp.]